MRVKKFFSLFFLALLVSGVFAFNCAEAEMPPSELLPGDAAVIPITSADLAEAGINLSSLSDQEISDAFDGVLSADLLSVNKSKSDLLDLELFKKIFAEVPAFPLVDPEAFAPAVNGEADVGSLYFDLDESGYYFPIYDWRTVYAEYLKSPKFDDKAFYDALSSSGKVQVQTEVKGS